VSAVKKAAAALAEVPTTRAERMAEVERLEEAGRRLLDSAIPVSDRKKGVTEKCRLH
jgi:hypothetical protein